MSGPDIFLSYNRDDAERAKHFADAFAAEGLDVWWDVALRSGEAYDEVTENALRNAKAVVVLWSQKSVVSRWVRAEATLADRNKTLVPAMIEPCNRPIMFELTQTADLSRWQGNTGDPVWRAFMQDVRRFVGRETTPVETIAAKPTAQGKREPERVSRQSIVVLPFANMSGDPEQEYFADGITEDIITDLSKVSALSVISRNSAFTFKGQNVDIVELATRLNVDHVLEGSVRKAGNRVRVTAQLIDGMNNDHVWAERFDRDLNDIFELQDELSQEIVKALKVKLVPAEKKAITERGAVDPEVYDLYIRALALQNTFAQNRAWRAVEMYREVVRLAPDWAQGWATLASVLLNYWTMEPQLRETTEAEVEHAVARAEDLAPDAPEVATVRAFMASWNYDWDTVESSLSKAGLHANAIGVYIAQSHLALGRARVAAELQVEQRKIDPLSTGTSFLLQVYLDAAGRSDEAEKEFERGSDLRGAIVTMAWRACTRAMMRGDHERVKAIFTDGFENNNHFMSFRPRLIEVLDAPAKALDILRKALVDPTLQDGARMAAVANWAIYFGDDELALDAIQRGLVDRRHGVSQGEIWMPMMAGIRKTPRFKQMIIDMGLAAHWRKTDNWGDFARPVGDNDFEIIA